MFPPRSATDPGPLEDPVGGIRLSDRDHVARNEKRAERNGSSHPLYRPHRRRIQNVGADVQGSIGAGVAPQIRPTMIFALLKQEATDNCTARSQVPRDQRCRAPVPLGGSEALRL